MTQNDERQAPDSVPPSDSPTEAPSDGLRASELDRLPGTRGRPSGDRLKRSPFFRTRRRTIITLLLCIPLLACLAYWLFGFVAFADAASVVALKGMVQTQHEGEAMWNPISLNQLLRRKDRVRTGASSSTRLLFFNVSTVDLGENTDVSIVQVAKRRGGNAVDIVIKTWIGKTVVRAVRFVDPSSTFCVDTPTASTVVRGARFTVEVTEEGTTQIDLEAGTAEVRIEDEVVNLTMGERITLEPSGAYETEQIFVPDAQLVFDKLETAWSGPGNAYHLELTEMEVNQFLAAMGQETDFFLHDAQVWFVPDEARIAATVVKPTRFDLSASASSRVEEGEIKPQIKSVAAGVALPVPAPVLNLALEMIMGQMEDYLAQAYSYVQFSDVQIADGYITITGQKQPGAPIAH